MSDIPLPQSNQHCFVAVQKDSSVIFSIFIVAALFLAGIGGLYLKYRSEKGREKFNEKRRKTLEAGDINRAIYLDEECNDLVRSFVMADLRDKQNRGNNQRRVNLVPIDYLGQEAVERLAMIFRDDPAEDLAWLRQVYGDSLDDTRPEEDGSVSSIPSCDSLVSFSSNTSHEVISHDSFLREILHKKLLSDNNRVLLGR